MIEYKTKIVKFGLFAKASEVEQKMDEVLNEYAEEGWVLDKIETIGSLEYAMLILKRQSEKDRY